jgi:hypothetical protein
MFRGTAIFDASFVTRPQFELIQTGAPRRPHTLLIARDETVKTMPTVANCKEIRRRLTVSSRQADDS